MASEVHSNHSEDDAFSHLSSSIDSLDLNASKAAFSGYEDSKANFQQVMQSITATPAALKKTNSHPDRLTGEPCDPRWTSASPFHGSEAPSLVTSEANMSDDSSVSPRPLMGTQMKWMNVHRKATQHEQEEEDLTCSVTTVGSVDDMSRWIGVHRKSHQQHGDEDMACSTTTVDSVEYVEKPPRALLALYFKAMNFLKECWSDPHSRRTMKTATFCLLLGFLIGKSMRKEPIDWQYQQYMESVKILRESFFENWDVPVKVLPSVL